MKIFSIAVDDKGEVKMAGDLELTQAKQLIEAILLQQAYQNGILKGQEKEIDKEKEVKNGSQKENGTKGTDKSSEAKWP